ncbi:hypothetical protein [Mycobacterium botniense]|uniref:Uncharacterized protein n=1 Tax=Mycobacterium botniense TaxID=84962 RepID=A0A7I9XXN0_9MYCO|nr:hypothetical protein [Mycobacterium botniense]GFG74497.1 hypothetical protein MBOT_18620 [Mycobacterium botniense]
MILVDSKVLTAHLRGIVAVRAWLVSASRSGPLALSAVSIAELNGGTRSICVDIAVTTIQSGWPTISSLQPWM